MVLLLWWQVSLFILLLFFFLGTGMHTIMVVQYIRSKQIQMKDGQKYRMRETYSLPDIHADQSSFSSTSENNNEQIQLQYPEQM